MDWKQGNITYYSKRQLDLIHFFIQLFIEVFNFNKANNNNSNKVNVLFVEA